MLPWRNPGRMHQERYRLDGMAQTVRSAGYRFSADL